MRTRFIISAPTVADCPQLDRPEFALVGRSNVGKSSLLNQIANAKIARTSRTPGRTQLINLFEVDTGETSFVLADLPGFGFARAPKAVARRFGPVVDHYLEGRSALAALLLLIDVRRGAEEEEKNLARKMIEERPEVRLLLVGTKVDKLPKAKRKPMLHGIAEKLGLPRGACIPTSAKDRIGVEALRETLSALSAE